MKTKKLNSILKDSQGYLINYKDWNKSIAIEIAKTESIILTKKHWNIIYFIRKFYIEYNSTPSVRILYTYLQKTNNIHITSLCLLKLFPKGLESQGIKIAGIPKPHRCI
ncbi:TusE/DsrC/DsvC family sulfur relay protein [Buchnera aphidicola (Thelaxes californica)]|uniref:Sulfurtransferase n=1 Tax=Buchnera aphidicola (Thelaxes californica) TaxID=1315998 RepID=A0A4D6YMB7_9GAMM|nr:TusE/DsrC/DsvC family sulfur relay protein [Buchnera aphidicola]QCI26878.1 TusE/DsrC/DsvC family sulfur relay protein [Buchnera aphidicola (Thelaxes californica)]